MVSDSLSAGQLVSQARHEGDFAGVGVFKAALQRLGDEIVDPTADSALFAYRSIAQEHAKFPVFSRCYPNSSHRSWPSLGRPLLRRRVALDCEFLANSKSCRNSPTPKAGQVGLLPAKNVDVRRLRTFALAEGASARDPAMVGRYVFSRSTLERRTDPHKN